jgi:hypothetical protein
LAAACLLAVIVLEIGCSKTEDSMISAVDTHGDEVMASTTKAEAREWMQATNHVFFKADPKQVAQYVSDFYQAGAEQVLIADIEEHEGYQYGEALLIVLPKDAAARTKLFQVGSRADTDFQNDPFTDQGQKYLYYSLD